MGKKKDYAVADDEYEAVQAGDDDGLDQMLQFAGNAKKNGKSKKKPVAEDEGDEEAEKESEEPSSSQAGKKKSKKKENPKRAEEATTVNLDEEAEVGDPVVQFSGKKKKSKKVEEPVQPVVNEVGSVDAEDDEDVQLTGKKKKKKGFDEESVHAEDNNVEEDEVVQLTGKKKKKKDKKQEQPVFDEESVHAEENNVEEDEVVQLTGKKKKKKEKPLVQTEVFDEESLHAGDYVEDDEVVQFTGKKKKKKEKKSVLDVDADVGADDQVADEEPVPKAESKKKSKKTEEDAELAELLNSIETSGKQEKKGGKGKKAALEKDEEEEMPAAVDDAEDVFQFTGKKKKKKGKKPADEDVPAPSAQDPVPVYEPAQEVKVEPKKKKTSNKKEEDDAHLAELLSSIESAGKQEKKGGKPKQDVVEQKAEEAVVTVEDEPADEERVETAAEKKKRKKKEKEKAAKAAAAAASASGDVAPKEEKEKETKKPAGKLPPKHVREKLEQLARMKEEEERRKREEEERIRKEEEERARLEQLEREREEAKRRRKEREKEKFKQKKAEGKILTAKQKEEQRRLALQREKLLAQLGGAVDAAAEEAPKRPKYETKKPKRVVETPVTEAPSVVEETLPSPAASACVEVQEVEEEQVVEEEPEEEEEEEEEDDWDAKSWASDDVQKNLKTNPFDDEDEEEEPAKELVSRSSFKKQSEVEQKQTEQKQPEELPAASPAVEQNTEGTLRSPICCILGHVDTGKTKLLDCIRRTNVQEGEAGGITQQIGATYFPTENIRERTKALKEDANLRVPGLLVIDTPGHESFTNLRARGSGLCDIAILVVDIMHGLEPQTIESLNLLKMRKTPLVVALNKMDRLYGWISSANAPIRHSLKVQPDHTKAEFENLLTRAITQLKEQGMNSEVYWKNKDVRRYTNIVPTSAISGEGIPDLLLLLIQLTQKMMESQLTFKEDLQCTVLEVKVVEGLGTTIDVILVNGTLHEGDQILVCGMQGPILTVIRALLTPHPMKELRVKGSYMHHKELKAAQGIKITAQGLEHAIPGSQLYVVQPEDDVETLKVEVMQDMHNVLSQIDKSGEGVCVQASTLGSLEALLEFLKSVKIPVSGISIGPVHKKDVMKANIMLERKKKEFATILAFDVKVNTEARELAEELGVRIFTADIIYHLFDQFSAYMENIRNEKRTNTEGEAVFPCILKILPNCVFNQKDPLILGVEVMEGTAKVGTPICVPRKGFITLGKIASLEHNHKVVDTAKTGDQVAVKIIGTTTEESQKMFGRHFELEDELVSHLTRRSIDVLKENFRDDVTKDEWKLIVKLKQLFQIQ